LPKNYCMFLSCLGGPASKIPLVVLWANFRLVFGVLCAYLPANADGLLKWGFLLCYTAQLV